MTLWTIQPIDWFISLEKNGVMRGDYLRVLSDVRPSYRWIAKEVSNRQLRSSSVCPVWAWFSYGHGASRRPDLRGSWHLHPGTPGVRVELNVPDEEVLLSQFEMWTWIMSDNYVPLDSLEDDSYAQRLSQGRVDKEEKQQSWIRIFDLNFGCEDFWGPVNQRWIQACLSKIKLDWVTKVDQFTAR